MPSTTPFSERIDRLHRLIASADRILIGAGAGLSAAAGLDYAGPDFEREFAPWIARYGITDLYSSSFYPFDTEEERWAYWARHIWFARFRPDGLPLYRQLRQLLAGKELFVLTTNVDAQFEKAGFPTARIFATQGDYAYLQARSGRPQTLIYNASWVTEAMAATRNCRIPSSLVPRHPSTGELMSPNLRCDATFVEDDHWHAQADAYHTFLDASCRDRRLNDPPYSSGRWMSGSPPVPGFFGVSGFFGSAGCFGSAGLLGSAGCFGLSFDFLFGRS